MGNEEQHENNRKVVSDYCGWYNSQQARRELADRFPNLREFVAANGTQPPRIVGSDDLRIAQYEGILRCFGEVFIPADESVEVWRSFRALRIGSPNVALIGASDAGSVYARYDA